ncbi:MAG TPA: glycine-rich protein [Acidimicrobiia bacterium]|jgi:hypothetical protein
MRQRIGAVLVAAAASLGWVAIAGAPATAEPTTQAFAYTGDSQSFVVPAGVCSVTIDAFGAQGGANSATDSLGGSLPGLGGEANATLVVSPGDKLTVIVGGQGGPGVNGSGPGAGGFGGGGAGGNSSGLTGTNPGSGGGGASAVLLNADISVIAGGGGGAGNSGTSGEANGGGGGGTTGGDGTGNLDGDFHATGGTGGTQSTPGAHGSNSDGTSTASDGTFLLGGVGAIGGQSGGAGGGGGWEGGGGGGFSLPGSGASGGGGGGAGYLKTVTGTLTAGVNDGDGSVSITYEPNSTPCSSIPAAPIAAGPRFTG